MRPRLVFGASACQSLQLPWTEMAVNDSEHTQSIAGGIARTITSKVSLSGLELNVEHLCQKDCFLKLQTGHEPTKT